MTKKLTKKQRHQVKSRWYYIFWGAATLSVFAGQMYVGSGYRKMSRSFDRIVEGIVVEMELPRHPMMTPSPTPDYREEGLWHPSDPPQRLY